MSLDNKRILVLISGNGSNLQAILDAVQTKTITKGQVIGVISNRKNAYGLTRAQNFDIPTKVHNLKNYKDSGKTRIEYDIDLAKHCLEFNPNLIVLAGFMHVLSPEFLTQIPQGVPIINLHPALPGQFDGAHAIDRAFTAFQQGLIKETGIMVHYVISEVDRGEPILTKTIPIEEGDSLETLETRIHSHEHALIVKAVNLVLEKLN
jgi:phosphoribosylglycinamide formyltransferase